MASLLADIFCLPSEAAARLKGVRAAAGAGVAFQPGLRSGLVISDSRSLVFQAALSAAARDRKVKTDWLVNFLKLIFVEPIS